MRTVHITGVDRDEGTIVVFDTLEGLLIAADHRPAQDIVAALADDQEVVAEVEDWQIIGQSVGNFFVDLRGLEP